MPDSLILYPLRPSSSQCYTQCKEGGPYEVKRLRLVGPEVPVQYIAPNVGRHIPVQGYDIHSTRSTHTADRPSSREQLQSTHYIYLIVGFIYLENRRQHPSAIRHPYTSHNPSSSISHPYIHTHLHTHIHQSSIIWRCFSQIWTCADSC